MSLILCFLKPKPSTMLSRPPSCSTQQFVLVHLSSVVQGVLLWAQLVGDNMVMRLES